jgi:O-antigen/teichoic acid export membrane protein
MNSIKRNVVWNLFSSIWLSCLNIALVPVFIRFMGIEAYGLVGFFATIQAALNLLDFGLSPAINRQMARYAVQPEKRQEARDLVRTLEVGYWGLALLIGGGIFLLSYFIAYHWLQTVQLPKQAVQQAIMLIGLVAACQWPLSFYSGGLQGLQKQVLLSRINICAVTFRFCGAAIILWLVSPTITAFFIWQAIASAAHTLAVTIFFWRSLPTTEQTPRFQFGLIGVIGRFAGGMGAITVVTLVLVQLDKIILSKMVPLEMLGYYTLASLVSNGLAMLGGPIFNALFPSFSELVAKGDLLKLREMYHRGSQLMAVVVLPVAVILAVFSHEVILLWTGDKSTAEYTHYVVIFLVLGTALNSLMSLPYALQLAYGWTGLTFYTNLLTLFAVIPSFIFFIHLYGLVGAAVVWLMLNSMYLLVVIPIMHRRLLPGEQWRWYLEDVGFPLAASILAGGMGRLLISPSTPPFLLAVSLAVLLACTFALAALAAPLIRSWVLGQIRRLQVIHD